jgi:hypothetical protein
MDVKGIIFATLDCDADVIEDYNRWYDLEHLPPNVALAGIMSGRRYVATPELHALRGPDPIAAFVPGKSTFATIYYLGVEDVAGVLRDMTATRDVLDANGRMYPPEKKALRYGEGFRLEWALAREGLEADERDIPHLGHTGIQIVLGEVHEPDERAAATKWYREVHAADVLGVPGRLACLWFASVVNEGRYLAVYLCEGDPADTVRDAWAALPEWRRRGRADSPRGAFKPLATGPYRLITPFQYDFAREIRASELPAKV